MRELNPTEREHLDLLEPWAHVEQGHPEWPWMWAQVPEADYQCPVTGEVWQYMGSVRPEGADWFFHEFRHRNFRNGCRRLARVPASERLVLQLVSMGAELARLEREEEESAA